MQFTHPEVAQSCGLKSAIVPFVEPRPGPKSRTDTGVPYKKGVPLRSVVHWLYAGLIDVKLFQVEVSLSIEEKWNNISEQFILKVCESFRRRVDTIIEK